MEEKNVHKVSPLLNLYNMTHCGIKGKNLSLKRCELSLKKKGQLVNRVRFKPATLI